MKFTIFTLMLMFSTNALSLTREYLYGPEFIYDLKQHLHSQPNFISENTTTFNGFEISCDEDGNPQNEFLCKNGEVPFDVLKTWSLSDFTFWNQNPKVFNSEFVVKSGNSAYGNSGIQAAGTRVGIHVSSYYPTSWSSANILSFNLTYHWSVLTARFPWVNGADSRFCGSHTLAIPKSYSNDGSKNQSNLTFLLEDIETNQELWVGIVHYASFPFSDHVGVDAHNQGTNLAKAISRFSNNSRYITLVPTSNITQSSTWIDQKFYGACINLQNLSNIITDINNHPNIIKQFSTNPAKYRVRAMVLAPEVYTEEGNGHMSMVFDSLHAYIEY